MPLTVGTRLGPFEVIAKLGEGGMGEVYRGRDATLGRAVALKVLPELSLAVIGGLTLSTPVTLMAIPGVYAAIRARR